ncbi:MAG: trans-sulfuration enzyme family protein, partial [Anaerolineales bacterium]
MSDSTLGPSTRAIHAGQRTTGPGAITTPIVHSATFSFQNTADLLAFMHGRYSGQRLADRQDYTRIANPTRTAVERKLAALEGAEAALLCSSGMAALTHLILGSLPTGAHIIMQARCYRGTRQLAERVLARLGIETTFISFDDPDALEAAIRPTQTRMIIVESPTNPHLRLVDFEKLAAVGQRHKIRTVVDSTLATPLNQRPLDYGIDYVVHSATKYLGGHHDVLAGVILGDANRLAALHESQVLMGAILGPSDAYLLERGLRTLAVRVARHNDNAQRIAEHLAGHPRVKCVWYPGLPS